MVLLVVKSVCCHILSYFGRHVVVLVLCARLVARVLGRLER